MIYVIIGDHRFAKTSANYNHFTHYTYCEVLGF